MHRYLLILLLLASAALAGGVGSAFTGDTLYSSAPPVLTRVADCAPAIRADGGSLLANTYAALNSDGGCTIYRTLEDVSGGEWLSVRDDRFASVVFVRATNVDAGAITVKYISRERGTSFPGDIESFVGNTAPTGITVAWGHASVSAATTANVVRGSEVMYLVKATTTLFLAPDAGVVRIAVWE